MMDGEWVKDSMWVRYLLIDVWYRQRQKEEREIERERERVWERESERDRDKSETFEGKRKNKTDQKNYPILIKIYLIYNIFSLYFLHHFIPRTQNDTWWQLQLLAGKNYKLSTIKKAQPASKSNALNKNNLFYVFYIW